VIAGAIALAATLAVVGFVFGVFDKDPARGVKVRFHRFDKSEDGTDLATLLLTNGADRWLLVREISNPSGLIFYKFISSSSTGEVVWTPSGLPRELQLGVDRNLESAYRVQLPDDGRTGRLSYFAKCCRRNSLVG
jgi:hypothetical protein